MMFDVFWLHVMLLGMIVLVAYGMHMRTLRLRAGFNLYRIRDKLVLLVATDQLPEDSHLFKHYYGAVNGLLAAAPKVGFDDVLHTLFNKFDPENFQHAVSQAKKRAARLASDPLLNDPEVRQTVVEYYGAIRLMMFAHSSILRVAYLLSYRFIGGVCQDAIRRIAPPKIQRGLDAVNYAQVEERTFANA